MERSIAVWLVFAPQRSNAFSILVVSIVSGSLMIAEPAEKLAIPAFGHASIAKIGVST